MNPTHDQLEEMLRAELGSVDGVLAPPHVDAAGLSRVGRRERRRRAGIGVAAGVAAVAVVTAGVVGLTPRLGDEAGFAPTAPTREGSGRSGLPVGEPSAAPYWDGEVVHVGSTSLPAQRVDPFPSFSSGTVATTVKSDGAWRAVVLRDGAEPVELAVGTAARVPFDLGVSPDGRYVGTLDTRDRDVYVVRVYDVERGDWLPSTARVGVDPGVQATVTSVTDDGRVLWDLQGQGALVTDGQLATGGADAAAEVTGLPDPRGGSVAFPGGLMVPGESRGDVYLTVDEGVYGTVGTDGTFTRLGTVESIDGGSWSPDGSTYVYPDPVQRADGEVTELRVQPAGGEPTAIDLGGATLEPEPVVGWESATTVVVDLEGAGNGLARCDVVERGCEEIPQP